MVDLSINQANLQEKWNIQKIDRDPNVFKTQYHISLSTNQSQQYWAEKRQDKMKHKKKKYLIMNYIIIILNLIIQGFLVGLNTTLIKIKFYIHMSIISLIFATIITLLETSSTFIIKNHKLVKKRNFILIYLSIGMDTLQVIANILILISVLKSSSCDIFIWNTNSCYQNTIAQDYIQSECDGLIDSDRITQEIYDNLNECLKQQDTSYKTFKNDMYIHNNVNFLVVVLSAISYKLSINYALKFTLIFKCLKFNRKISSTQQKLDYLSSCTSSTNLSAIL